MDTAHSSKQDSQPPNPQQPSSEVAGIALSMRIPPFWRDKPRLWFFSFEAATADQRKSQAQLAQMVLTQLDKQDIEQIADLLYKPPETGLYNALKDRLITAYEESDSQQFQKLLSEMELGDQKPSQLLRRMRNLARDKVPDSTLQLLWTTHLPSHVSSVLAVSESFSSKTKLDDLALLADKMMERTAQVSAVSTTPAAIPSPAAMTSHPDTQFLVNEIRKLSLEIAELKSRPQYENRRWNRQRSSSRSRSHSRKAQFCYYHRRFGDDARKCDPPCTYKPPKAQSEN